MGFALACSASAGVVAAAECTPVIEKPWVRAAPPGASTLAGYLVLRNPCEAAVEVSGVESRDFGMPMIHRTEVVDGVSRMRPAGKLVVPPGGELRFEPGGLHLMLMKPRRGSQVRPGAAAGGLLKHHVRILLVNPIDGLVERFVMPPDDAFVEAIPLQRVDPVSPLIRAGVVTIQVQPMRRNGLGGVVMHVGIA